MRFLHIPLIAVCALVLFSPPALKCSTPPRGSWDLVHGLPKGQTIALTYKNNEKLKAEFQGFTSDTLLLRKGAEDLRIQKDNIAEIEVASNTKRTRNTVIGAVLGLSAGAVWGRHINSADGGAQRAAMVLLPAAGMAAFAAFTPAYKTIYRAPKEH